MMACDATAHLCRCIVEGEHDVHECACGGSWKGHSLWSSDFQVVRMPVMPVEIEEVIMSEYPEHEKLAKVVDKSQAIGEFLDWMQNEHHVQLAVYHDDYYEGNLLMPLPYNWTRLLHEYFGIDADVLEGEKVAILEAQRAFLTMNDS